MEPTNSIDESLKLKLLKGTPILLDTCNLFFIQRTIGEIIDFGYEKFLSLLATLFITKEEVQEETQESDLTPYLYFLAHCSLTTADTPVSLRIKDGLRFLSDYQVTSIDKEKECFIGIVKGIDNVELTEEGFEELLSLAKIAYYGEYQRAEEDEHELSPHEKEMRDKFNRLRKLRDKTKQKEPKRTSSFSDLLGGFVSKNPSLSWQDTMNLTHYGFYFLLRKLRQVEDYDLYLQAIAAGAKVDKEVPHWLEKEIDGDKL